MRGLGLVAMAACGRLRFEPVASNDAANDGAGGAPLAWVATLIQSEASATTSASFTLQARGAGDAVLFHVGCDSGGTPTTTTASAPGWSIQQLGALTGAPLKWGALFVAIAPDTAATTVTYSFNASCAKVDTIVDEFANVDQNAPFDAFDVAKGTTGCLGTVTTMNAGDAIWAACSSGGTLTGVGAGYTKAGDDTNDDWSEFKLTDDPAGSVEGAQFLATSSRFVMTTVALKAR